MRLDKTTKEVGINRKNKYMDWGLGHTNVEQMENQKEPAKEDKDQQKANKVRRSPRKSEVKWRKQFKEEEMITNFNYSLETMTVEDREQNIWQNRGHWILYQSFSGGDKILTRMSF